MLKSYLSPMMKWFAALSIVPMTLIGLFCMILLRFHAKLAPLHYKPGKPGVLIWPLNLLIRGHTINHHRPLLPDIKYSYMHLLVAVATATLNGFLTDSIIRTLVSPF